MMVIFCSSLCLNNTPPPIECNKRMFLHYIIFEEMMQKIAHYTTLQDRQLCLLWRVMSDTWDSFFRCLIV